MYCCTILDLLNSYLMQLWDQLGGYLCWFYHPNRLQKVANITYNILRFSLHFLWKSILYISQLHPEQFFPVARWPALIASPFVSFSLYVWAIKVWVWPVGLECSVSNTLDRSYATPAPPPSWNLYLMTSQTSLCIYEWVKLCPMSNPVTLKNVSFPRKYSILTIYFQVEAPEMLTILLSFLSSSVDTKLIYEEQIHPLRLNLINICICWIHMISFGLSLYEERSFGWLPLSLARIKLCDPTYLL